MTRVTLSQATILADKSGLPVFMKPTLDFNALEPAKRALAAADQ